LCCRRDLVQASPRLVVARGQAAFVGHRLGVDQ
jgi:hypothetical protein